MFLTAVSNQVMSNGAVFLASGSQIEHLITRVDRIEKEIKIIGDNITVMRHDMTVIRHDSAAIRHDMEVIRDDMAVMRDKFTCLLETRLNNRNWMHSNQTITTQIKALSF